MQDQVQFNTPEMLLAMPAPRLNTPVLGQARTHVGQLNTAMHLATTVKSALTFLGN